MNAAKAAYDAYIRSPVWQKQRKEAFSRWGRFCSCCGADNAIHVHHLNYRNLVDVTAEDLMPLCEACHGHVHLLSELDRMARTHGDPMEKRRMVILRIKQSMMGATSGSERKRRRRAARVMEAAQLALWERVKLEARQRKIEAMERRNETQALRRVAYLSVLTTRYACDGSVFTDWPDKLLKDIIHRRCTPVFARPPLRKEIEETDEGEALMLTREDIEACRTARGAFTRATTDALGLSWNQLRKGWVTDLIGKTIPKRQYLRAKAGASIYAGAAKGLAA